MTAASEKSYWAWADSAGIWGIGTSPEEAEADAEHSACEPVAGSPESMTRAAYEYVEAHGYDCQTGQREPVRSGRRWRLSDECDPEADI